MSTKSQTDEQLVALHLAGDKAAFQELVSRHQSALHRLIGRYLKAQADVEDLTQRTFVRVLERLHTYRGEASFRTWLYRVAVNLALNHRRGAPPPADIPVDDIAAFTNSLDTSQLAAAEVYRRALAHLENLPPKQRLVVELRAFHELDFDEIAVLAECSASTARVNYHHGLKRLRDLLPPPSSRNR